MSKNLSQIIADLVAKPTEGMDLSSQIRHLGVEIKNAVQNEDTMSGKFSGLLDSLREIIPDEKQRYQSVFKTLSVTAKLGRQEILKTMSGQLEELKTAGTGLMHTQAGWHAGQKGMEARTHQLKGELAQLRGRLAQLESEEKAVQTGMAAREKNLALAEKSVKDLFSMIGSEIGSVQKKVEELTVEASVARPAPPAEMPGQTKERQKSDAAGKRKEGEKTVAMKAASPQRDTRSQRKCPMCGGRYHLLELGKKWQCFTCAYEEPAMDELQSAREEVGEPMSIPAPAEPATSSGEPASRDDEPEGLIKGTSRSGGPTVARKKSCPFCFKKMTWFPGEKAWRCPAGHYERKVGPGPGSR